MSKLINLIIGSLFLTSCAGIEYNTNYIPEIKELRKIENIPYKRKGMNCLIKATMYSNHLTNKGIESYVIVRKLKDGRLHALVKYWNNGNCYTADPTNKGNDDEIKRSVWK